MNDENIQGCEKGRERKNCPLNKQDSNLPESLGEQTQGQSISKPGALPDLLGHMEKKAISTDSTNP